MDELRPDVPVTVVPPKEEDHPAASKPQNTTPPSKSAKPSSSHPLVDAIIPHGFAIDHKADDSTLLDVHIENPLRRITTLLEEIKKQKAFSFNIRGSLGLAGVALTLGAFGFFGGTKALCSKGIQSEIGVIKVLNTVDSPSRLPGFSTFFDVLTILQGKELDNKPTNRIVLIKNDSSVLHIPTKSFLSPLLLEGQKVIVTGEFDSCGNNLTVENAAGIQVY